MEKELEKLKNLFNTEKSGHTHCFSLVCWTDGMWGINVTDSWQMWSDKEIPKLDYKYPTPNEAIDAFFLHIKKHNIDVKKLQEVEK